MKSSRQRTAKLMFILFVSLQLIAAPLADAFTSSATANHPISIVSFEATKKEKRRLPRRTLTSDENNAPTTTIFVEKVKTERRNLKYDLGLGKNQPVNNDNGNESSSSGKQRSPPTQFLVEHESVRPYPSPLNLDSQQSESSNNRNEAKSNRKNLPKVQPRRQSKDVLHIRDPIYMGNTKDDNAFGHPVIVPINHSSVGRNNNEPAVKFDLNTVWVEMMLHSEHKKLVILN